MGTQHQLKLLVTCSSYILAQLRRGGFYRLDPQTYAADTPQRLIEQLGRAIPDAVILEHDSRGVDAFALCQTIRTDLELTELPVIVISRTSLSRALLSRIASSGCSEVLTTPLSRGQLHDAVCELLNLPYRRQRRCVVRAKISVERVRSDLPGQLRDVTMKGARIRVDEPLDTDPGQALRCRFDAASSAPFDATIVWKRPYDGGTEFAVEFDALPEQVARYLKNLLTWRLEQKEGGQRVILQEQFTEVSDFSGLIPLLRSPVVFDLRNLKHLNSIGVSRWVNMLRKIPDDVEFSFARCSVTFCVQAGFIAELLGRGRITSLFAPFECLDCLLEEECELEVGADGVGSPSLPAVTCPSCRSAMTFADLPDRYFEFLKRTDGAQPPVTPG